MPSQNATADSLFANFGTTRPFWRFLPDSDALQLTGEVSGDAWRSVQVPPWVAAQIRALGGGAGRVRVDIELFAETLPLQLVGRKINNTQWGGTAALATDAEAVTLDLEASLNFAEKVVSEVNSLVIILDSQGRIKRFNKLCEEVTGVPESSVLGQNAFNLFVNATQREDSRQGVSSFFQQGLTAPVNRPINTRKGVRMIQWRNTLIQSGNGIPEQYLVCSGTDITEELAAHERLAVLANTDVLTGLPNRHSIQESIVSAIETRSSDTFAVLFLDLDHFKRVNDAYGHAMGDSLIQAVAKSIQACLSEEDTLARLGGDEFLILVRGDAIIRAPQVAERVLKCVSQPIALRGVELYSGGSIGISMYPLHGNTLEALVRCADTAMYAAKDEERGTYRLFESAMNDSVRESVWLDENLRRALKDNQFELFYQPKVSLQSDTVNSVEALIRWRHPERGMISPGLFIPYAEQSGLIAALGQWVLVTAAKQAAAWKEQGIPTRIAINVSARQLKIPTLVQDYKDALSRNGLEPSLLDLELTESCLVEDEARALALIKEFRALGAQIHLDDFGTGYSSLSQLVRMPLDVLKLDGSFIAAITEDPKAQALVRSITKVGRELNMRVVAECVETREQAEFLRSIDVEYAQGYLFGKPMPADEYKNWLEKHGARPMLRLVA